MGFKKDLINYGLSVLACVLVFVYCLLVFKYPFETASIIAIITFTLINLKLDIMEVRKCK